jgi:hypothetical protein
MPLRTPVVAVRALRRSFDASIEVRSAADVGSWEVILRGRDRARLAERRDLPFVVAVVTVVVQHWAVSRD